MISKLVSKLGRKLGTNRARRKPPQRLPYAVLRADSGREFFVKGYHHAAASEFERGEAIWKIASETGRFEAPRPLNLVESTGIVVWEFLSDIVELRDYIAENRKQLSENEIGELFSKAGYALGLLHKNLPSPAQSTGFSPFDKLSLGEPSLKQHVQHELARCPRHPQHWDFCGGNIFVRPSEKSGSEQIVILDAMANQYVPRAEQIDEVAPIYVDIGQMLFGIWCHPRFSREIHALLKKVSEAFLTGYEKSTSNKVDRPAAYVCAAEITQMYIEYRNKSEAKSSDEDSDTRFRQKAIDDLHSMADAALNEGK